MRALVAALLLGLCAWRSHVRLEAWRSDEALWTAAVAVSPDLPRPSLNLAVAQMRASRIDAAVIHAESALRLAQVRGDVEAARRAVGLLIWIDVLHIPLCDPPWRSWCVSGSR